MELEESSHLPSSFEKLKITSPMSPSAPAIIPRPQISSCPLPSYHGKGKPRSLVSLCLGVLGQNLEDILNDICEIAPIFPPDIKLAITAVARRKKLLTDDILVALADHMWYILDISGSNVTDVGLVKVAAICTNLRAVDISLCDHISERSVSCLIGHCHSLETLRCGGNPSSNYTARRFLKYLMPTLQCVEEESWEELEDKEISIGAPSLRWLVWPKIDDNSRQILAECPRISINPTPSLLNLRGMQVPREAFPNTMLDDSILEDIDPKTWAVCNVTPRIRIQAPSSTFELPIAERFRLAFEERDARLAPKRAKNARQHKRRAERERMTSNMNAKSLALAYKANKYFRNLS
ncbi:hypothetical protein EJ110_NYTH11272 [Nymphaea thermarum]|nr:hypothetical protein EJ110_NYTH11272 [Nymphaea thermarum]